MKKQSEAIQRRRSFREQAAKEPEIRGVIRPEETTAEKANPKQSTFQATRELVETLVIALFLSILFKFFEAEAYVIPTGSMAPTLMGRHKDVVCEQCRFPFQVSASEEMDNESNRATGRRVVAGTCPQCGFTQFFPDDVPSYSGDRVMVNKCVADIRETRRWDVSVFRCPADPRNNYIKRIVGLPNENIRIQYGDLFVQKVLPDGRTDEGFEIVRKPLVNLLQMLQVVDDNDYPPTLLLEKGWPTRWTDDLTEAGIGETGWIPNEDGRGFYFTGAPVPTPANLMATFDLETPTPLPKPENGDEAVQWIRYRHIVPSSDDWFAFAAGKIPACLTQTGVVQNNPQLITDQTAYNTGISQDEINGAGGRYSPLTRQSGGNYYCRKSPDGFGLNWTGDLAVSFEMKLGEFSDTPGESIYLDLVKGGVVFRAVLLPAEGKVRLEIPGTPEFSPEEAAFSFQPNKTLPVIFLNIDEQMRLVLGGREIEFSGGGKYDHLCQPLPDGTAGVLPRNRDPNLRDLVPVSIGAKGGAVAVSRLKILRDVYYIAMGDHVEATDQIATRVGTGGVRTLTGSANRRCDRFFSVPVHSQDEDAFSALLSDPTQWKDSGNTRSALFSLGPDRFFALGDNSGLSQDSRLWGSETIPYYVVSDLMIGKALCVYWPHGKLIPGTNLPWIPNFRKMRKID